MTGAVLLLLQFVEMLSRKTDRLSSRETSLVSS